MSEIRRRTILVPVRMTPAEAALLDAAVEQTGARGRGTMLREAFQAVWPLVGAPGWPADGRALPGAPEGVQSRPRDPGK